MVKQVAAWQDDSGNLHDTRQAAAASDLRLRLLQLGFKTETVNHLIDNRIQVIDALRGFDTPDTRDANALND